MSLNPKDYTYGLPEMIKVEDAETLSEEEEFELAAKMQAGDLAARDKLIMAGVRWAMKVASREAHWGVFDHEELHARAALMLTEKISKFEPSRGRLTTFVSWCITRGIQRDSLGGNTVIRLPYSYRESAHKNKAKIFSINKPAPCNGVAEAGDVIPTTIDTAEEVCRREEQEHAVQQVYWALDLLPERYRQVIEMRYLQNMTLKEAGVELNLTRERVRQIQLVAEKLLRQILKKGKPKPNELPIPDELEPSEPPSTKGMLSMSLPDMPRLAPSSNQQARPNVFAILEQISNQEIQDEKAALLKSFDEYQELYRNRLAALNKLESIIAARDGLAVPHKKKGRPAKTQEKVGSHDDRVVRNKSNVDKIKVFLGGREQANLEQIMVATGITKGSCKVILETYPDYFVSPRPNVWELTQGQLSQTAS